MKQQLSTLCFLLVIGTIGTAQSKHEKTWGGKGFDGAFSSAPTTDGGYIITGLTKSKRDSLGDIFVFKLDAKGDTNWTFYYGGNQLEGGNGVILTKNGDYFVSGHTQSFGKGECDFFALKLNKNGEKLWFKVYGEVLDDIGTGAVETFDGGFLMTGNTANYGAQKRDVYFVKIDSIGDTMWTKRIGGAGMEYGYALRQTPDSGFLTVGMTASYGAGKEDGYLLKMNKNGDTLWTKTYGDKENDRFYDIQYSNDGGYIIAGFTTDTSTKKSNGWLVKLDAKGNKDWSRNLGSSNVDEIFYGVSVLPTGEMISAGSSKINDSLGTVWSVFTNENGLFINSNLDGVSGSYARTLSAHNIQHYLLSGSTKKVMDDSGDLYYIVMDSNSTSIRENTDLAKLSIYPNPVTNEVNFILPTTFSNTKCELQIIDYSGRVINSINNTNDKIVKVNMNGLPQGLYMYHIIYSNGMDYSGKVMKR